MKNPKSEKSVSEKKSSQMPDRDDFLIVGIGASAGGVQALKTFFENVPADSNAAYVVILHLSPDFDSQLAHILQTVAKIPVTQVKEKVRVEANHVYIVNAQYGVVHVSENAGRFLQISGELSPNLFKLIQPELRLPVSTAVYQAVQNQTNVVAENLQFHNGGEQIETINVSVRPVLRQNGEAADGFILIIFEPAENSTDAVETEMIATNSAPVARQLEKELMRSHNRFQTSLEQTEVQAEELKASNEELQAINEELRTATEELETGKEELHSVNEELIKVNQELKIKIEELSQSNNDLQNLINSANIGTIFLDRNFRVKLFTPIAGEIFNLISADNGRHLSDITHKLENEDLTANVEAVLNDLQPVEREVRTSDGKFYLMQITPYRTSEDCIGGTIITFVNITTRKQTEENLRASESFVRSTLNSLIPSIAILDRDGAIIEVNSNWSRFAGENQCLASDNGIGENYLDVTRQAVASGETDAQPIYEGIEAVLNGKSPKFEWEYPCHSPTEKRWFFMNVSSLETSAGGAVVSHHDITSRKIAEENVEFLASVTADLAGLETIDELMETVGAKIGAYFELSVCAFFEIDEAADEAVVTHEWHREDASDLTGVYRVGEFVTGKVQEASRAGEILVVGDTNTDLRTDAAGYAAINVGAFVSVPFIRDGQWRFLLVIFDAQPRDWQTDEIELIRELTNRIWMRLERARAVKALYESEERLRLIMNSVKDYAIITTDTEGIVNGWNSGAEKIFGYAQGEILGQTSEILFTTEERENDVPAKEMQKALEKGNAEDERWHIRKDGSRFYVSGMLQPLRDGKLDGYVKIARDMTERIEAEQMRHDKEMLQKLVCAQEDERRRIARDLHDELGQLLTALRLQLEAVRKLCSNNELCGKVDEAQLTAKHLDAGIDFLAWELRPAALDDFGLYAALIKYVREWSHFSGVTAELLESGLKKARFMPEVETNLYRIAQEALNNTHKHANAKSIEVSLDKRDGDLVVLIIADDGCGFEPADKMNRDKGIGLIGMKERAALIGGFLEIESAPGKGTTVFVRLPASSLEKEMTDDE